MKQNKVLLALLFLGIAISFISIPPISRFPTRASSRVTLSGGFGVLGLEYFFDVIQIQLAGRVIQFGSVGSQISLSTT